MWEAIKAGTFYIISSPLFLIKNTYKYFHNRNEFNTAKKEESFSWKDYYFWKNNKEIYISELEKLIYYETTLKENVPIANIQNENAVFAQILYNIKQDILNNLEMKKKEVEQLSCKMFTERKITLIKDYDTKILSLKFTLDHLKENIDMRNQKSEIRKTALIEMLESKILEGSRVAAQEREASYAASTATIMETVNLKKLNLELNQQLNDLTNELTEHKGRNVRLAYSLDKQNKVLEEMKEENARLSENVQKLEYQVDSHNQIKTDNNNLNLKIKVLAKEVERLSAHNNKMIKDIHNLEQNKIEVIDDLKQSESQIMKMKESHQIELQQFKEGAKKQGLLSEAMTVEIEKLEATLKQVRKEKHTIETICASLTNNNSEPLLKLVDSLGKTVAQFETVNESFMPTLNAINRNFIEINSFREKITAMKEQRSNIEKAILYLVDLESGNTASKSSTPDQLESLRQEAVICVHAEERDTKHILDLTTSNNKLQEQLTKDVNTLDFYFQKINQNYDDLIKRIEMDKANETFVKAVTETGNINKSREHVIKDLKLSTIHQRKPAIVQSHEVLSAEVTLRNLSNKISQQTTEVNIPIKNPTNNEEVD